MIGPLVGVVLGFFATGAAIYLAEWYVDARKK